MEPSAVDKAERDDTMDAKSRREHEVSVSGLLRREEIRCVAQSRRGRARPQSQTHDEALRNSGHLMLVASLAPTRTTASVRPRNGQPSVTDGPFAETKEQIGAFFIIEARDLDEATRVASQHPAAHLGEEVGWGVEVRPIDYLCRCSRKTRRFSASFDQ